MPIQLQTPSESILFPTLQRPLRDSGTPSRTTIPWKLSGRCKLRLSVTPNLGLLPLPFHIQQLCPKTKEAQCEQRWEVSIRTELERQSTKCCENTVSLHSDRSLERQDPKTREAPTTGFRTIGSKARDGVATGETRHLSLLLEAGTLRGLPFTFPDCLSPLSSELPPPCAWLCHVTQS